MKKISILILLSLIVLGNVLGQDTLANTGKQLVYKFDVKEEIGPAIWRKMQKALAEAKTKNANIFLIHMNTYGGTLLAADSMRTAVLQSPIPTYVFIDNNAASAGALISIACDSIYMRSGANIGAATVVNGTDGKAMPDKYQSYMRGMMRATAEAHGGDTLQVAGRERIEWRRNPRIAEAMVDDRIVIPNVSDSGKTLTFTTNEAIQNGYCEGKANSINEVLEQAGVTDYEIVSYKPTIIQQIIGFLVNPALQGVLLMILLGGIWFELQSPGIGFPLLAAVLAGLLYFMPLLLEGLADYWEIGLFVLGVLLLLLEVFVIPGFGIAGFAGFALMLVGLVLSLVGTLDFEFNPEHTYQTLLAAIFQIAISFLLFIGIAFTFGGTFLKSKAFRRIALNKEMKNTEGFVGVKSAMQQYIGKEGVVLSDLRPSGSIKIEEEYLDAVAISGFISKGKTVRVRKFELGQLYVEEIG